MRPPLRSVTWVACPALPEDGEESLLFMSHRLQNELTLPFQRPKRVDVCDGPCRIVMDAEDDGTGISAILPCMKARLEPIH
jgi:hypothetical protein